MREPTRAECEQRYPILRGDPAWRLWPTVGRNQQPNGFAAEYRAGGRVFDIVITERTWPELAAGGEG